MAGTCASKISEPNAAMDTPHSPTEETIPEDLIVNVTTVHGTTIDLPANDVAMVKLFERLGALKGAASFFVLDQGIDSLAAIHDLDDDAIESLWKLCRKPKPGHTVALCVET